MPDPSPSDQSRFIKKQAALLDISQTVLAIKRINDLENALRAISQQMRNLGLDFSGLAFQRLIDAQTQTFEEHFMRPDGVYQRSTDSLPATYRKWQAQQVVYRRDLSLPKHREGVPDEGTPLYLDIGVRIRCILHAPNSDGVLTLCSETPDAFSDAQVDFFGILADMLGLAIACVQDVERLKAQNEELAQNNADLRDELAVRKRDQAALVETERLRALKKTAGATAHEINQPLTVVIGLPQVLLTNLPEHDPIRNDLQDIIDAGTAISRVVKKMQNAKKYETRHYIGDSEIVDFDAAAGADKNEQK